MWIIVIIMLIIFSISDIKYKSIKILPLLLLLLGSIVISFINNYLYEKSILFFINFIPGTCLLIIGFFTNDKIGYGDGIVLIILANFLGIEAGVKACFIGLWCSFFIAIYLLIIKKKDKATRIPFIPCLTMGVILQYGGMLWGI